MKKYMFLLTAFLLVGCQSILPVFSRVKPNYAELPVEQLKQAALKIERAVRDGEVPQLEDTDALKLNEPAIQQAVKTRAARIELINELLDNGFAWEKRNGHVYIIRDREYKKATTRRGRDRNALIISGEWKDRWMLYERIRKINQFPPDSLSAIQRIFHEARLSVLKSGQKYENEAKEVAIK